MIIYYSGTGNSRYIAEMLADILDDSAVSVNEIVKKGEKADLHDDKRFVFVSPIYVYSPSYIIENFIKEGSFSANQNAWFIMNGAASSSVSAEYFKKLCNKKHLRYMGTAHVIMPQNYLLYFKMKEKPECERTVSKTAAEVVKLSEIIRKNNPFEDEARSLFHYLLTVAVRKPYYKLFVKSKQFYATEKCTGCGICASVCPLNNIRVENGKPIWANNCTHCTACINYCPQTAIEYGNHTAGKPRYYCADYKR